MFIVYLVDFSIMHGFLMFVLKTRIHKRQQNVEKGVNTNKDNQM